VLTKIKRHGFGKIEVTVRDGVVVALQGTEAYVCSRKIRRP
jgi:hypothetical protein